MGRGRDSVVQGTGNPDPERETYLTLLRKSVAPTEKSVKVIDADAPPKDIDEELEKEHYQFPGMSMTPHDAKTAPDPSRETYTNLLKKTVKSKVKLKKVKKESVERKNKELEKHKSAVHIRMTDDRRTSNDRTAPDLLPQKTVR